MPYASPTRKLPAVVPALALAAVLAAGCKPPGEYGYDRVSHRDEPEVPQAAYPDPPAPNPAVIAAPAPTKVVLSNPPAGVTQAMADAGAQLFATGPCTGCHGPGGSGSTLAPALNDASWINISGTYPEIVAIINNGVPAPKEHSGPMPPKGGGAFDEQQVRELAAYVYALSHGGGAS